MMTHAVIGHSVKRTDLLDKVTGNARYVADMPFPGLLFGKLKRCNVAHARIRRIDTSRALALPGV
jgi:xanthine dehydrogenase molybdenum-binding subunit